MGSTHASASTRISGRSRRVSGSDAVSIWIVRRSRFLKVLVCFFLIPFVTQVFSKRDEYANKFRDIYEEDEEEVESKKSAYADCLMFSEWLVDIPGTLSTDWIMMPCPEGRRCLVVASKVCTVSQTNILA